jgi:iron complex outermembrane recepter protein
LTARVSATYLDAKYLAYSAAPSGPPNPLPPYGSVSPLISVDASGNPMPQAPKFTLSAGLNYSFDTSIGEFNVSGDYYHSASFVWEPDALLRQSSYDLFNSQIRYSPNENVTFGIWGRNLSDKKYYYRVNTQAGAAGYPYVPAAPRTYGVSVDFIF